MSVTLVVLATDIPFCHKLLIDYHSGIEECDQHGFDMWLMEKTFFQSYGQVMVIHHSLFSSQDHTGNTMTHLVITVFRRVDSPPGVPIKSL